MEYKRFTRRIGKNVFVETNTIPRTDCLGEYGVLMCPNVKKCENVSNRKCPTLQMFDRLAELEDKIEIGKLVEVKEIKEGGRYIAPEVKIGDVLFCVLSSKFVDEVSYRIEACRVTDINYFFGSNSFLYCVNEVNSPNYPHNARLGKDAFVNFEEAEKVLNGRRGK